MWIKLLSYDKLNDYLSTNNLLNSFQSDYIKYYSTETTLLSVHDYIIRALSHQKVTCLTLLDLSAAFDTIYHSILLDRLSSWFGSSSTALSWIKSYLLNRSFYMSILKTLKHLYSNSFMEFLNDPSLVFYSSSYTPLLLVLSYSYIIQQRNIYIYTIYLSTLQCHSLA